MKLKKNHVYDILSVLGFIYVISISFLVYARIDENGTIVSKMFSSNVSFKKMNEAIDSFFNNIFHIGISNEEEVDGNVTYLQLEEHKFKLEDQRILALKDGVVTYMTKENEKFVLVIDYGEYETVYKSVKESNVANMDHILQGEIIGEYEEYFIAYFYKEGKQVEWENLFAKI